MYNRPRKYGNEVKSERKQTGWQKGLRYDFSRGGALVTRVQLVETRAKRFLKNRATKTTL